ncbi:MAG: hypothetical protein KDA58_07240 [Planctomycetaceae bacterium]|nr:hypothetical protein [Planctomycetaceae bacterium]
MSKASLTRCMIALASVLLLGVVDVSAQQASQEYLMHVPPRLVGRVDIVAPNPNVPPMTHDGTDNPQVFPPQFWDVGCNNADGAEVTFYATRPFRKSGGGQPVERDAQLDLRIVSADPTANWLVTNPTAVVDGQGGGGRQSTVTAESTAPGNATFHLTVSFLGGNFVDLPMGDYTFTVFGVITAK